MMTSTSFLRCAIVAIMAVRSIVQAFESHVPSALEIRSDGSMQHSAREPQYRQMMRTKMRADKKTTDGNSKLMHNKRVNPTTVIDTLPVEETTTTLPAEEIAATLPPPSATLSPPPPPPPPSPPTEAIGVWNVDAECPTSFGHAQQLACLNGVNPTQECQRWKLCFRKGRIPAYAPRRQTKPRPNPPGNYTRAQTNFPNTKKTLVYYTHKNPPGPPKRSPNRPALQTRSPNLAIAFVRDKT